jgi:RNA polymerase primary sigma factor
MSEEILDDEVLDNEDDPTAEELSELESEELDHDEVAVDLEVIPSEDKDLVRIWLAEMVRYPMLPWTEQLQLARRYQAGDRQAKDILVCHNLRLVVSVAKRYVNYGMPFIDLIQEGNIGLMKAVDKFKPELGYRLTTYATWWIKQSITRALHNKSSTIRIPVHMRMALNKLGRVRRSVEREGATPTIETYMEFLGMDREKVIRLLQFEKLGFVADLQALVTSQRRKHRQEEGTPLGDLIPDEKSVSPDFRVKVKAEFEKMKGQIELLCDKIRTRRSERDCKVFMARYGFGLALGESATLEETGAQFQVTRERIRQVADRCCEEVGFTPDMMMLLSDRFRLLLDLYLETDSTAVLAPPAREEESEAAQAVLRKEFSELSLALGRLKVIERRAFCDYYNLMEKDGVVMPSSITGAKKGSESIRRVIDRVWQTFRQEGVNLTEEDLLRKTGG